MDNKKIKRSIISFLIILGFIPFLASCSSERGTKDISDKSEKLDGKALKAPDFSAINDVKAKKQAFFSYFKPIVDEANKNVLKERLALIAIQRDLGKDQTLNNNVIKGLCKKYRVVCNEESTQTSIKRLLLSVDAIPASLALAQAANESAWGTSRFAKQANNYFGQWCYKKGCGLVPKRRNQGAKHEVRTFNSPYASVSAYIFNLNSSKAYSPLRLIRENARKSGRQATGLELAKGLSSYSERGGEYVREIQSMIRQNNLQAYE